MVVGCETCSPKPKCPICKYYFTKTVTEICESCTNNKNNFCDNCGNENLQEAISIEGSQTLICFDCLSKCHERTKDWILNRAVGKPTYLSWDKSYQTDDPKFQRRLVELVRKT